MANFEAKSFGTRSEILHHPIYKAFPQHFPTGDAVATSGVMKAGTIWPSNDDKAQGIVLYDVTLPGNGAIVYEGSIRTKKLPTEPDPAAKTAMKGLTFFPLKED